MNFKKNILILVALTATQTLFAQEQETIELNAIVMPKTNVRGLWYFGQELVAKGPLSRTEQLKDGFGLGVNIETPIWNNFAAGFYFQGYRGLSLAKPRIGLSFGPLSDGISDPDPKTDALGYNVLGVGAFIKPQIALPFSFGDVALSLRVPLGVESIIGMSRIGLFKDRADIDQFKSKTDSTVRTDIFSGIFGFGFRTGATLGIEYYPVYLLGIFAEAGYEGAYHLFSAKVVEDTMINIGENSYRSESRDIDAGLRGYYIHGWTAMIGLKTTY